MTDKRAEKLIKEIMDKDAQTAGIFISLLSYNYIQKYGISNKEFIKSLKNSLKIIEENRNND